MLHVIEPNLDVDMFESNHGNFLRREKKHAASDHLCLSSGMRLWDATSMVSKWYDVLIQVHRRLLQVQSTGREHDARADCVDVHVLCL